MRNSNPDDLTWRFKMIVSRAFTDEDSTSMSELLPENNIVRAAAACIKANTADELAALVAKAQIGNATEVDKNRIRLLTAKI